MIGKLLSGRYQLGRELGHGGMGAPIYAERTAGRLKELSPPAG